MDQFRFGLRLRLLVVALIAMITVTVRTAFRIQHLNNEPERINIEAHIEVYRSIKASCESKINDPDPKIRAEARLEVSVAVEGIRNLEERLKKLD